MLTLQHPLYSFSVQPDYSKARLSSCNTLESLVEAWITAAAPAAGKFKAADLIAFLNQQAGTATTQGADDSPSSEDSNSQQEKKQEKHDPQIVRNLNMSQFEDLTDEEDAWLVAFYSGTYRRQYTLPPLPIPCPGPKQGCKVT